MKIFNLAKISINRKIHLIDIFVFNWYQKLIIFYYLKKLYVLLLMQQFMYVYEFVHNHILFLTM